MSLWDDYKAQILQGMTNGYDNSNTYSMDYQPQSGVYSNELNNTMAQEQDLSDEAQLFDLLKSYAPDYNYEAPDMVDDQNPYANATVNPQEDMLRDMMPQNPQGTLTPPPVLGQPYMPPNDNPMGVPIPLKNTPPQMAPMPLKKGPPSIPALPAYKSTPVAVQARQKPPSNKNYGGGIKQQIAQIAKTYGINPAIVLAVAQAESGFRQGAKSPVGAIGMMQLMPGTAKGLGVNPYDMISNIKGGAKMLSNLNKTYKGNLNKVFAAYNAGPGAVAKYGGIPPYRETQNYVKRVLQLMNQYR
jgi:hypothetical protein